MVDPVVAGSAIVGGYAARRLFGPSLDVVAETMAAFTRLRLSNIRRVIDNAQSKLDGSVEGGIPPRVALRVIEEGSYSDDQLVVEYLGGILASSHTPRGRDDRGSTYISQISQLSSYDLRAHFTFYSEFRRLLAGRDTQLHDETTLANDGMAFVPYAVFEDAMDFGAGEDTFAILVGVLHSLRRESLLTYAAAGDPPILQAHARRQIPGEGLIISPTVPGIDLYLWALGAGRSRSEDFLDLSLETPVLDGVEIRPESLRVKDLPQIGGSGTYL